MADGSRFNEDQLKAINHLKGPAMVIAGPGSGKTTVITNRITKLIGSGAAKPSEIMVITFTTAAADEMKSRFLKLNALTKTEVVFGTFHSVFLSFLKQYSNFQNLRLATQKESIALLRECVSHLYPDKNFTSDYFTHLLGEISRMKNGMYSSASLSVITKEYMREMSKAGLFDYDDMILLCLRMLKSDQKALSFIRASVKFILIDEFQDINRVQFEAVKLIAAPLNNLFVVGDDDQSIYAFRGSDPGIMLSFRQHFPQTKYIGLFTNYRSSPEIIGASLKLISHNRSRYFKKLNTANTHGPNITVWNFYDSEEEAEAVCRSILHYTRMDPERYKSFGILFRTHRAGNAVFREVELRKARDKALAQSAVRDKAFAQSAFSEIDISLLTFHASKGLEFDVVYIISADEGITPGKLSGGTGSGSSSPFTHPDAAALEEERRLFYVAMTRAKKVLHISNTNFVYNKRHKRSRFVNELKLPVFFG